MTLKSGSNSWKRLPDHANKTYYERQLGKVEAGFYWDSIFSRTADMIRCAQITVLQEGKLRRDEIIAIDNVIRAWTNVKRRFPLLGARLLERGDDEVFLRVDEDRLGSCLSNEISFRRLSASDSDLDLDSSEVAERLADRMMAETGLSNDLLARIIIAWPDSDDGQSRFYFLFANAHVIADGLSTMTIIKTFLNELCRVSSESDHHHDLSVGGLEDRLALSVASEELNPAVGLSRARRRWRWAIATVLARRMIDRLKGGHGLPQKASSETPFTPARSTHRSTHLPPETSARIIQNCRKNGIKFGDAYPIIGQVATARVLLRRYLQGKIDEEEWDFRKKEPMYSAGPINLRPILGGHWQMEDCVCVAIGFYFYSLSFLPLGAAAEGLKQGMRVPEVGSLLSRDRFMYRAKQLVQHQAKAVFAKSPVFLEVGESMVSQRRRVERAREIALVWRENGAGAVRNDGSERILTPMERSADLVVCNGGSSIGNLDKLLPYDYPIITLSPVESESESSIQKVKLSLDQVTFRLRCRPGELYLGAVTIRERLRVFVHFDSNVFEEDVVDEWLDEVKMALEFYLGGE